MQELMSTNGIEVCYETFGDRRHPAALLVMGFAAQLTAWPSDFCRILAERGFFVIRFDNRDVGLSSKTDGPSPDVMKLYGRLQDGAWIEPSEVPYTLSDMAADAIGVLDGLDIDRAHVIGASMGGMIVQHLAFDHASRLHSATSIMSTTGQHDVGQGTPEALTALLTPSPTDRAGFIEQSVINSKIVSGPLWTEAETRTRAGESYDRMFHPAGPPFHLAAIAASGDRSERLGSVDLPFLVIHGAADALIDVSGGHATAAAVPGADLLVLASMGHDLPRPLWPQLVNAIGGLTERCPLSL